LEGNDSPLPFEAPCVIYFFQDHTWRCLNRRYRNTAWQRNPFINVRACFLYRGLSVGREDWCKQNVHDQEQDTDADEAHILAP
jgi:hypothetical protein